MKKITAIILTCMLILSLAFAGVNAATEPVATVTSATGEIGDRVTVTISVDPAIEVKTGGVSFTYNDDALDFISGTWNMTPAPSLNSFGYQGADKGAFTAQSDISAGASCAILTFEILGGAIYGEDYEIDFTFTNWKNANGDIITLADAKATITVECDCEYGAWVKLNDTQHVKSCAVCGDEIVADHNWDNGVVTTEASHLVTGIKTYTCADCGATYTEEIDKLTAHTWDKGVVTSAATCTQKGVKTFTCACGETYTEDIAMIEHTGGKATCSKLAACSVCGTLYGTFDKTNHATTKVVNELAATTEKEGYTGDTVCADCGALISSGSVIEKLVNPSTADNSTAKIVCITVFGLALIGGACIAYKKERDF